MSFKPIKLYRRPKNIDDPAPDKPKPNPNPSDNPSTGDTGSSDNTGYTPTPDGPSDDTSTTETYPYYSWFSSNFESPYLYNYLGDITPLGWPAITYESVYKNGDHFLHWKNSYENYADRVLSSYPKFKYKLDGEDYEILVEPGLTSRGVGGMDADCRVYPVSYSKYALNDPKFLKLLHNAPLNFEYNVDDHEITDIQLVCEPKVTCQYKDGSKTFEVVYLLYKRGFEPENVFPTTMFKTYDEYIKWFEWSDNTGESVNSAYLSRQQYDRFMAGKPLKNVFIDVFYPEKNPNASESIPAPDLIRTHYDVEGAIEMSYTKDGNFISEIVKVQDAISDPTGDHSSFAIEQHLNGVGVTFKVVEPVKLHIDGTTINLDVLICTDRGYLDMKEGDYSHGYMLPATIFRNPSSLIGGYGDCFRILCAERSTIEVLRKRGFFLV